MRLTLIRHQFQICFSGLKLTRTSQDSVLIKHLFLCKQEDGIKVQHPSNLSDEECLHSMYEACCLCAIWYLGFMDPIVQSHSYWYGCYGCGCITFLLIFFLRYYMSFVVNATN